jgi:KipI family sensor histidine kinase inhibitor
VSFVRPFGEAAFLVETEDATAAERQRRALQASGVAGVRALVPGRSSLLVEFDPLAVDADALLRVLAAQPADGPTVSSAGRVRRIPVVYGGEHGPDLEDVARLAGVAPETVVELHVATELRVLFGGFAPGFAYLGEVAAPLRVPRLATPRTQTPAGAVALADGMSGIYPATLPGGWRVIGRTPISLFDPHREPPAYLLPGDHVRFGPISPEAWAAHAGAAADW